MSSGLPIDEALPALRAALLTHRSVVLQAPAGAGKSTVVPLALLDEPWVAGRRILMLEPRRLATRAVAMRMAATLGERVGARVGYRMRLDTRISAATRVEVVTEGVLTRMLQEDAALEGIAAVIFDEFHERSLQADLGLALTLDARAHLTPQLRVLVMSATLDGQALAGLLGDAPLISAPGRLFPVETRYAGRGLPLLTPPAAGEPTLEQALAQLVRRALREQPGDLLVFLPGAREIRRLQAQLQDLAAEGITVRPLFGELSGEQQDVALAPAASGTRKVILATNIAETSLTIPGVRAVVDCGLTRRARFDPNTGMQRLETQRISRASAEQRRGRAGRTAPGVCYRLWSEGAQATLAPFTAAEIQDADLAPLALELAGWGDEAALRWLDAPPAATLASARELLQRLGALDAGGRISAHGRAMARLGVHPRLAHMLLNARELDAMPLAAELAALLSERDLLRGGAGAADADVRTRLEILRGESHGGADRATVQRAQRGARELARRLPPAAGAHPPRDASAGVLLAFAYPDRIGRRRPGASGRYTLANGRGAEFVGAQALARQEFIVAVDLDDRERDARILLAAPLQRAELLQHFAAQLTQHERIEWDTREQAVLARRSVELGALVLEEGPLTPLQPQDTQAAMLAGVRALGLDALPWSAETRNLQARVGFVRSGLPASAAAAWPDLSDAALLASLELWLAPYLDGVTRRDHLARLPLADALRAQLDFQQQRQLEEWAPTHLGVPSGSRIRIDWLDESAPLVAVRLQEVFGLTATPLLGPARAPVTFRLLSPAQRPVQVTQDLASFWRAGYAEVRKDLRGRYPKHYWPEDPLAAQPTRAARRPR
ncbi:MAG TPA: ATP-dependent helicase HrpB [Steroidobacteraceae bacterium]|nr:ATP-dependent helicase HrpB [Steroidobacteraceae bacterium]